MLPSTAIGLQEELGAYVLEGTSNSAWMALCQTGRANSEIDQEFWNNSGKVLGHPADRLLSDLVALRVDRGCFHDRVRTHEELAAR